MKEAEKKIKAETTKDELFALAQEKYKVAIENHKKRGITTYILMCESGETCLIRKPSVKESSEVSPFILGYNVPLDLGKAGVTIIEKCWIAGDDAIRKTEDLLYEVGMAAVSVVNIQIADVKKN